MSNKIELSEQVYQEFRKQLSIIAEHYDDLLAEAYIALDTVVWDWEYVYWERQRHILNQLRTDALADLSKHFNAIKNAS